MDSKEIGERFPIVKSSMCCDLCARCDQRASDMRYLVAELRVKAVQAKIDDEIPENEDHWCQFVNEILRFCTELEEVK